MRLWSLHPRYLDSKGLVALWREGLLAQKVLMGKTKGYKNHPQLNRFKDTDDPECMIALYLQHVYLEAKKRGYNFDKDKVKNCENIEIMHVSTGQLEYEFKHLLAKLKERDPDLYNKYMKLRKIQSHPLFVSKPGKIERWEIIS